VTGCEDVEDWRRENLDTTGAKAGKIIYVTGCILVSRTSPKDALLRILVILNRIAHYLIIIGN